MNKVFREISTDEEINRYSTIIDNYFESPLYKENISVSGIEIPMFFSFSEKTKEYIEDLKDRVFEIRDSLEKKNLLHKLKIMEIYSK